MLKISVQEDCGNAPKQLFIREFCIAGARAEISTVLEMLTDDIRLEIAGYKTANGKEEIQNLLKADTNRPAVTEMIIQNILTHGNQAAANGVLKFSDGGVVAFCNMYTFNSHRKDAKLKLIQTYSIVL